MSFDPKLVIMDVHRNKVEAKRGAGVGVCHEDNCKEKMQQWSFSLCA